jgi:PAS domain S-box-containing protein
LSEGSGVRESEHERAIASLRRNEAWLAAQKDAFQAAVNDAPLEEVLAFLISAAIGQMDANARCAFYIANSDGTELRHVVGMPESYARHVDGFKIGLESLACGLAVGAGQPVITPDVLRESRWTPWRWLAKEYDYRACWSFPVETSAGKTVGTFAMYFREPCEPTAQNLVFVASLTHAASIIISRHQEAEQRALAAKALRESEARLQAAIDLVKLGCYAWNPQTGEIECDDRLRAIYGLPADAPFSHETWRASVHPDDFERVVANVRRSADPRGDGQYGNEYRVIGHDRVERWIAARGRMTFQNEKAILFQGVALDVTERKRTEQANLLLIAELQHRTRNLLALVNAIATDTLAASHSLADFAATFGDRLTALSRVQGLLSRADTATVTINELVRMELQALGAEPNDQRVSVEGPEVILPKTSVQILALALHELVTNARKHGALATPEGHLAVAWHTTNGGGERNLVIEWREQTAITSRKDSPPGHRGFGRTLIEEALPYQLDAQTRFEIGPNGVFCSVAIGLDPRATEATQ